MIPEMLEIGWTLLIRVLGLDSIEPSWPTRSVW